MMTMKKVPLRTALEIIIGVAIIGIGFLGGFWFGALHVIGKI